MGWFDEQVRLREKSDDEIFSESLFKLTGAITGQRLSDIMNDERQMAREAMFDVLKFYHIRHKELPKFDTAEEELEYLLRPAGMMSRKVELGDNWYKDASGAMLALRTDDNSIIALLPGKITGYSFYDSRLKRNVFINKKNKDLVSKEAMVFYKPLPMKKIGLMDLLSFAIENITSSDLTLYVFSLIAYTLVGLLIPFFNNILFSSGIASGSDLYIYAIASFMVSVSVSYILFHGVNTLVIGRISSRLELTVKAATMMRLLSLPASFFRKYSSGELAGRAEYLTNIMKNLLTTGFSVVLAAFTSLIYVWQMSFYASALVTPALMITFLITLISLLAVFMEIPVNKRNMEAAAKEQGISYSFINGIQKIRLSGAEKRAFARWTESYAELAKCYHPPLFLRVYPVICAAVSLIGSPVIYFTAYKSRISAADYITFNSAFGMLSVAFNSLIGAVSVLAYMKPVYEMVKPVLDAEPEISEAKNTVSKLSGRIELNNLSFRYDKEQPMLFDNLTIRINSGDYVAIVGKTGSGKSTLLRLLLGFESPDKGAIYYDNRDLKTLDLKSIRKKIGVVLQNGSLFSGDIYSNIAVNSPELTMDEAWEAAEIAGIAEDIRRMPMGMSTVISEGGGVISGGQKQRLMIARAIASKPSIIMLDEATSALDNITQKKISEALDRLKCTRIIVAHRLSTIKQCSRIIVISEGKIVEDGNYDELLKKNGVFSSLVKEQIG